jgi:hypothetical protein
MTVVTEPFADFGSGACTLFMTYDDRNRPDDSTRWKLQSFSGQNNSDRAMYLYVEDPENIDPTTGKPFIFYQVVQPHTNQTWDIPPTYQNRDPYSFNWGGGGA